MVDCDSSSPKNSYFSDKAHFQKIIWAVLSVLLNADFPAVASGSYSVAWHGPVGCGASVAAAPGLAVLAYRLESGLSGCGTSVELPHSMWDLLGPGSEVVSSGWQWFLTTGPRTLRHTLKDNLLTGLMYVIKNHINANYIHTGLLSFCICWQEATLKKASRR